MKRYGKAETKQIAGALYTKYLCGHGLHNAIAILYAAWKIAKAEREKRKKQDKPKPRRKTKKKSATRRIPMPGA